MQAVEKSGDVPGLRAQLAAGRLDDGWIQSETLRDVDAGRRTRHAELQLVSRLQRGLIKTYGGIDHRGRVGGIDFERSVMSRNDGHRADPAKMFSDCDCQRGAFFGISGRAQLVQDHK